MRRGMTSAGRRKGRGFRRLLGFCVCIGIMAGAWAGYQLLMPSNEQETPVFSVEHPLFYKGEFMGAGALLEGDEIKLPIEAVTSMLGSEIPIRYEADSESIILTNGSQVLRMKTDTLTAKLGSKPFKLAVAPETRKGIVYVPLTPLNTLYGVQAQVSKVTGAVTLAKGGDSIQYAIPGKKELAVRNGPSIHSPYIEKVPLEGRLTVWKEEGDWYSVQGPSGYSGYARKSELRLSDKQTTQEPVEQQPELAWKSTGQKINLTWEAVYNVAPDPAKFPAMEGVNVVSPTWFELMDGAGQIRSKADANYAKWARSKGIQVWALFSNGFDPERTTQALANVETRFSMIQQLLAYAKMYQLQGINIDFENVRTSDKGALVQFVRELTPMLHEQGLVVSIDVTPKSNSEMWSLFLDRAELIQSVDYMMLMAYDEHWASSPQSGSVASLPWVENSILRLLEEDKIPGSKLILSMPLYTRIWTEKTASDGSVKVSSKAVGMNKIRELIATNKLKPEFDPSTGQNYVQYPVEGGLNRIWIEDKVSLEARIALVHKYGLAGVATWSRSFQADDVWSVIHNGLSNPS